MIDFDDVTKIKTRKRKRKKFKLAANSWSSIQSINNWRFWIWRTNSLFILISHQTDIGKVHLYAKDRYEGKYQLLVNKGECTGLKHLNDFKAFIEYSNDIDDSY